MVEANDSNPVWLRTQTCRVSYLRKVFDMVKRVGVAFSLRDMVAALL